MFRLAFPSSAKTVAAAALLATLTAGIAPLAARAGEVQNRFHDQQARIDQGVASGQLTQGEYNRDEAHLRADERARNRDLRRNDGHLTRGERARLNGQLNNNSNRIYFSKHNRADQPGV